MKKLLIALLLVAAPAFADEWFEMPNSAGGKIILLRKKCPDIEGRVVIATTPSGRSSHGCWFPEAEMVHIIWSDGQLSSFDYKMFKFKETK